MWTMNGSCFTMLCHHKYGRILWECVYYNFSMNDLNYSTFYLYFGLYKSESSQGLSIMGSMIPHISCILDLLPSTQSQMFLPCQLWKETCKLPDSWIKYPEPLFSTQTEKTVCRIECLLAKNQSFLCSKIWSLPWNQLPEASLVYNFSSWHWFSPYYS